MNKLACDKEDKKTAIGFSDGHVYVIYDIGGVRLKLNLNHLQCNNYKVRLYYHQIKYHTILTYVNIYGNKLESSGYNIINSWKSSQVL